MTIIAASTSKVYALYDNSDTPHGEWEEYALYEYRVVGIKPDVLQYEYRCPKCRKPLRVGLTISSENHPGELAGALGEDLGLGRHALVCRNIECRALIRLSYNKSV